VPILHTRAPVSASELGPGNCRGFLFAQDFGRDPSRPSRGEQLLSAFGIIVPERGGLSRSKEMEWFKGKTSIAGYQISNWMIVLGAIIIVLLIFQNSH
jgi:hypothetical protein